MAIAAVTGSDLSLDVNTIQTLDSTDTASKTASSGCLRRESMSLDNTSARLIL